jgi:hypothetical protein
MDAAHAVSLNTKRRYSIFLNRVLANCKLSQFSTKKLLITACLYANGGRQKNWIWVHENDQLNTKKSQALDTPSYQKRVFGILLRAANGKNSLQIRSENAHLAMLNSAFRASLE